MWPNRSTASNWLKLTLLLSLMGLSWLTAPRQVQADGPYRIFLPLIQDTSQYPNCRLGVGLVKNPLTTYAYKPLRLGWYVDWQAASTAPAANLEYYRTLRVHQNKLGGLYLPSYTISPQLTMQPGGLGPLVQANPGQVWLIGNEPDRPYSQDDVMPEMYAQIYHDAYHFIKGIDPTARVANGALVQPTPLRLQYLDKVLVAYQLQFDAAMPIDVFNMHAYMIDEAYRKAGADVPPGSTVLTGTMFSEYDHLDATVFASLLTNMRQWMAARGYQQTPLVVSEYGALYPLWYLDDFGLTQGDINQYLTDVNTWIDTARSTTYGYAPDDYRLVQRAAIYSLDDDGTFSQPDPDEILYRWGSFLFHSTTPYTRTATGSHFATLAGQIAPRIDLRPYSGAITNRVVMTETGLTTVTLRVAIANSGNTAPLDQVTVRFTEILTATQQHVSDVSVAPFQGCGSLQSVNVEWTALSPGYHTLRIEVDPKRAIPDIIRANNVMTTTVLIVSPATQ